MGRLCMLNRLALLDYLWWCLNCPFARVVFEVQVQPVGLGFPKGDLLSTQPTMPKHEHTVLAVTYFPHRCNWPTRRHRLQYWLAAHSEGQLEPISWGLASNAQVNHQLPSQLFPFRPDLYHINTARRLGSRLIWLRPRASSWRPERPADIHRLKDGSVFIYIWILKGRSILDRSWVLRCLLGGDVCATSARIPAKVIWQ